MEFGVEAGAKKVLFVAPGHSSVLQGSKQRERSTGASAMIMVTRCVELLRPTSTSLLKFLVGYLTVWESKEADARTTNLQRKTWFWKHKHAAM